MRRRWLTAALITTVLSPAGCTRVGKQAPKVVDLDIASEGDFLAFRPDTLNCRAGVLVRLRFHHMGKLITARHDWVLLKPGQLEAFSNDALDNDGNFSKNDPRVIAATPRCDKGQTVTTEFIAPPPGDYPFVCSIHPEDMRGVLHVTR